MHIPVPWMFVLTYLLGVLLESICPVTIVSMQPRVSTIVGFVLFALGGLIAGWGWMIFHKAGTTTIPGRSSLKLVTWGPYRFTRNPMYLGLTFAYLGEAALLKQVWPVFLLPLMLAYLNWTVIPVEEKKLIGVFRDQYEQYRAHVHRWI
jgi:protein-S-isoprenylcysteine O-methyltransferase Ste14